MLRMERYRAEQFFAATGADIRHGGTRAYYAGGVNVAALRTRASVTGPGERPSSAARDSLIRVGVDFTSTQRKYVHSGIVDFTSRWRGLCQHSLCGFHI
jgi:hypothetical protein